MDFPLTKQEVFDIAYAGVIEQGEPSMKGTSCVYIGPEGKRCAASFVFQKAFPNLDLAEFDEDLSGVSASDVCELIGHNELADFMDEIQAAHDCSARHIDSDFVQEFKSDMKVIAKRHGLNV